MIVAGRFRRSGFQETGTGARDLPATPVVATESAVERIGTPLRDAAVKPEPGDFLVPTNAGSPGPLGNPHGPHVVAPEIEAIEGAAGRVAYLKRNGRTSP